mmetsp:Transcript_34873/g.70525  ORF Transcript_34873/g.70525 Transcript_34873/m.70525 type:complete len:223 (-) Transcript_34873:469-1137(-)
MNELPTKLFQILRLLLVGGELVVPGVIPAEIPNEDGGNHGGKDEDNDEAVGDGQPVDLGGDGIIHREVDVPPGGPVKVGVFGPDDVVGEEDLAGCQLRFATPGVDHVVVGMHRVATVAGGDGIHDGRNLVGFVCTVTVLVLVGVVVIILGGLKVMLDGEGFDGEANDAVLVGLGLDGMVHNLEIDVIVNVGLLSIGRNEADGKALPISRGDGGIVLDLGGGR